MTLFTDKSDFVVRKAGAAAGRVNFDCAAMMCRKWEEFYFETQIRGFLNLYINSTYLAFITISLKLILAK